MAIKYWQYIGRIACAQFVYVAYCYRCRT